MNYLLYVTLLLKYGIGHNGLNAKCDHLTKF